MSAVLKDAGSPPGPEPSAITAAAIRRAREKAAEGKRRVVDMLVEDCGLDNEAFVAALAKSLSYDTLSMADMHALQPAFDLLPFKDASQRRCVLLRREDGELALALGDPFEGDARAWVKARVRAPFAVALVHPADVDAYLLRHEETLRAMDSVVAGTAQGGADGPTVEQLSIRSIAEDASPVVRLVHSTLYDAFKIGASDIHLESDAAGLTIKYRLDGVLTSAGGASGTDVAEQVISRIKVMSELDIAERRIPQDGRFKVAVGGREVDFRVSIMPSIFGEDAVIRILDKQALSDQMSGLRLASLGFDADAIAQVRKLSREPYGMLLVTGPTGSGKTTTLYAAITEVKTGQDKIITIEDPVEYQLGGVLQIPVNEKKQLTFARGLRSILRHDPDKIMVGEIRDAETAQIAIQSALTGHLVFTTVHANNAFDVIGRFVHMGVDPYSFVSALNGVVAQRLVRVLCTHCAVPATPDDTLLAESGLKRDGVAGYQFREAPGCGYCRGTGYKGRRAIAEFLVLNDEIRELIIAREPTRRIREAAARNGTRFLRDAALDLVRQGATSLQEINRVTFVA
jgi:general secretion pathway protein E